MRIFSWIGSGLILGIVLALGLACALPALAAEDLSARPRVRMVDLGAKSCIPCKMMIPVIASLEKKYAGRAEIVFIDVWEHPEQAKPFGIRLIPTQIFYDSEGKESFRHEGFFDEESIEKILNKLLAG